MLNNEDDHKRKDINTELQNVEKVIDLIGITYLVINYGGEMS